jgi:hypothetical protein
MADPEVYGHLQPQSNGPVGRGQETLLLCPLSARPCQRGIQQARECCDIVAAGFDPVSNVRDFSMLACASENAARAAGVSPP